jgi:hypothetical protein
MSITTSEFERNLSEWLAERAKFRRCEWCGCDDCQRHIGPRSKLCDSCKEWRRKERLALDWQQQNPDRAGKEEGIYYEYCVQFAATCREEGHIRFWEAPVTAIRLEWELESLTQKLFGKKDTIHSTETEFKNFSDAQRRLLMYLLEQILKIWLQHRRSTFATERALMKWSRSVATSREPRNSSP